MHTITLEKGMAAFLDGLAGKNRSGASNTLFALALLLVFGFGLACSASVLAR